MKKIKISVLVEVEYTPKPEYYPPGTSIEQMMETDLIGVKEDPYLWLDSFPATWNITGKVIDEQRPDQVSN